MNLELVPKYTKFNKSLKQVHLVYVHPQTPPPHVYVKNSDHLPVPILITKPKHKGKHVHIAESIKNSFTSVRQKYFEPTKTQSTVTEWVKKKKALNTLKNERKKERKRLQEWERWKKRERELVRKAELEGAKKEKMRWKKELKENKKRQNIDQEELEKAQVEREQEFYDQIREQERYRAELAKHTLKTRHPKSLKSYSVEPSTYRESGEPYYYSSVSSDDESKGKKPKKEKPPKPANIKNEKPPKPAKVKNEKPPKPAKVKNEKPVKVKKEKSPKADKVKTIDYIDKSSIVKPYSASRSVYVKEKKQKEKLSRKFVNCFYKFCCEFYCWMTIILAVGMAIVLLI